MIRDTQVTLTGEGQLPLQSRAPASLKLQTQPTEVGTGELTSIAAVTLHGADGPASNSRQEESGDESWKADASQHLGRQRTFLHKQILKEILQLELIRFDIRRCKNPRRFYATAITNWKVQRKNTPPAIAVEVLLSSQERRAPPPGRRQHTFTGWWRGRVNCGRGLARAEKLSFKCSVLF